MRFVLQLSREGIGKRIVFLAGLAALIWLHLHLGTALHSQRNFRDANIPQSDQKHNMKLANWAQERRLDPDAGVFAKLPHFTDGVVAPLWPWVASFLPGANTPDAIEITPGHRELFHAGRQFHLHWTAGFVVVLGLGLTAILSRPSAFLVTAATSLVALLPRTAYFQPEPLLYALFLVAWIFVLLALSRGRLLDFGLAGLFAGLAYLAKSSAEPMVLALLGVLLAGGILHLLSRGKNTGRPAWNAVVGLVILVATFLFAASPRLVENHRQFGDPFHSYPSVWMWMDNFDEGFQWMVDHPDGATLSASNPSSTPSLGNYIKRHGLDGFITRLASGTGTVLDGFFTPNRTLRGKNPPKPWKKLVEERWLPLSILAIALLGFGWSARVHLERRHLLIGLFVVGSFLLYACAFGFYVPIGKGDRFLLLLYAPLFLSLIWATEAMVRKLHNLRADFLWNTVQFALFALLIWRVVELLRHPVFES